MEVSSDNGITRILEMGIDAFPFSQSGRLSSVYPSTDRNPLEERIQTDEFPRIRPPVLSLSGSSAASFDLPAPFGTVTAAFTQKTGATAMRRPIAAGNWKMNTTRDSAVALARAITEGAAESVDVVVAPPFPYLLPVAEALQGGPVVLAAQNAYFEAPGAFTGEVALDMLADCGCRAVILGHSERRHVLGETDDLINRKVRAALAKNLQVILCVGELKEERLDNKTEAVLDQQMEGDLQNVSADQMANVVIAYEPVWAIGTGLTATPDQAEAAHLHLRNWLTSRYNSDVAEATRILYGGSVKPANAAELIGQPNVDGALVGGASLKADQFVPIIEAAAATAK